VQSVAGAEQMPFVGGWSTPPTSVETVGGIVEDAVHNSAVTWDYFSTMKIPVIAGRGFAETDRNGSRKVAVVSEAMARKYWSGENPIGRRVRVDAGEDSEWITVVGIVGDIKYRLQFDPFPGFYVPYAQWPHTYQTMVIETSLEPLTLAPSAREAVWAIDPDVPVTVRELGERIRDSYALTEKRFGVAVLGSLAGLAALLAVVGIYGVLAYTVSQRTHEIGVKMALGAGKSTVMKSVLFRGLTLAVVGLGIGCVLTIAFSRVMESLLFEVSPTDPATMMVVAWLVTAAALLASYFPALAATKVDPVEALRQE
jgi:putative ABC transport system permease protein